MSKQKSTYDGAALRASRDQRFAALADPKAEAERYEASFLRNIGAAGEDYAWILANEAWLRLGFETFTEWYERRVAPVAARLGLRPAREQAKAAIEKAAEEQKALPKDQRRSQRDLARVFGVSQATISRAASDSNESNGGENAQVSDPVAAFPAVEQAVAEVLNNQAAADDANASADGTSNQPAGMTTGDAPAAGPDVQHEPAGPAVNPANLTAEEPDGTADRADSSSPPASDPGVSEPGGQTDPVAPAADESVEEPEQDGTGVDRPAPAPSDPAALLVWLADVWEQVDADVAGPLLTGDDMDMISTALDRIVFVVELLTKWRDRAQP